MSNPNLTSDKQNLTASDKEFENNIARPILPILRGRIRLLKTSAFL
jgi:hypothetical protein